jgi:hypothetical protein
MLRETKTSEVTQAADQDGPKIERQNFEDEILHWKVGVNANVYHVHVRKA